MRVAIFSDVHGNLTALQAVLADIEKQSPDYMAFAGDLCVFGARPAETLVLVEPVVLHVGQREVRHVDLIRAPL